MVILKSADGVTFEVEESVVEQFHAVKNLFQEDLAGAFIPLPNVDSQILAKVIDFCKRHANDKDSNEDLRAFDAEFVNVDRETLYDLIVAANYLNVKSLHDLTCQTVADMIKGKSPNEIRNILNISNEIKSPEEDEEEEEEIHWENAWTSD